MFFNLTLFENNPLGKKKGQKRSSSKNLNDWLLIFCWFLNSNFAENFHFLIEQTSKWIQRKFCENSRLTRGWRPSKPFFTLSIHFWLELTLTVNPALTFKFESEKGLYSGNFTNYTLRKINLLTQSFISTVLDYLSINISRNYCQKTCSLIRYQNLI